MWTGSRGASNWLRPVLAGSFGLAAGYLALYLLAYSAVRHGAPDGGLGTALGYVVLLLPLVGLGVCLRRSRQVPAAAWMVELLAVVVVLAVIPHPPSVDCGGSAQGYTCPGITTSDPRS